VRDHLVAADDQLGEVRGDDEGGHGAQALEEVLDAEHL